jgi:hypothetical protein
VWDKAVAFLAATEVTFITIGCGFATAIVAVMGV